jgi:hypothetical protein
MGTRRFFSISFGLLMVLNGSLSDAAKWSPQYVRGLPDSAFAVVETTDDEKMVRHLPHHDVNGKLDISHLCNALSRLDQVKWRDTANAKIARQHLNEHLKEIGRGSCRPPRNSGQ